jgi:NTP pyrophosphatase (non-canonical NTP hydrolase)
LLRGLTPNERLPWPGCVGELAIASSRALVAVVSEDELMDRLLLIVEAQKRRFPDGLEPFKMITRLVEECGELATEIQVWEDEGLKRAKHGAPDRARTAKEVMDVLTAALTIADHYGITRDVEDRIELSIARARSDGFLPEEAAAD